MRVARSPPIRVARSAHGSLRQTGARRPMECRCSSREGLRMEPPGTERLPVPSLARRRWNRQAGRGGGPSRRTREARKARRHWKASRWHGYFSRRWSRCCWRCSSSGSRSVAAASRRRVYHPLCPQARRHRPTTNQAKTPGTNDRRAIHPAVTTGGNNARRMPTRRWRGARVDTGINEERVAPTR